MPDAAGKLTTEEHKKVQDWVAKFSPGGDAKCPICQTSTWFINPHLVQPVTLGAGFGLQLGGIGYPQITMNCIQCGYTMFLNAVMVGIIPSALPPATPIPTPDNQPKS
jgi:hypothetical protein